MCDTTLARLETHIRALRHLDAPDVVQALRELGIRCGQLGEWVHAEDVGMMRCPPEPSDADDAAKGDMLVSMLADLAWGVRHAR